MSIRKPPALLQMLGDDGGGRAEIGGDAVDGAQKVVGPAFEHGIAGGQPFIVLAQRLAGGAVLRLAVGHRGQRGGEIEDPAVAGIAQQPRRPVEIRVDLGRAPGPADLVAHLHRKAAQRVDHALLIVGHVVQHPAGHEEGVVGGPVVLIDLAGDQGRRHIHRLAAAIHRCCRLIDDIVVDRVHPDHATEIVEEDQQDCGQQRRHAVPPDAAAGPRQTVIEVGNPLSDRDPRPAFRRQILVEDVVVFGHGSGGSGLAPSMSEPGPSYQGPAGAGEVRPAAARRSRPP